MTADQLEKEILKLPRSERAELAQRLLMSLDGDPEVDQAWYDLAQQRLAALESGADVEVPAEEVFRSLGVVREP